MPAIPNDDQVITPDDIQGVIDILNIMHEADPEELQILERMLDHYVDQRGVDVDGETNHR